MWSFGIRLAAIRLLSDAGYDARNPVAGGLVQLLVWSSKAMRRYQSLSLCDRAVVLRSAIEMLEWRDPATFLAETCSVSVEEASAVVSRVANEAVSQIGIAGSLPLVPSATPASATA